MSIESFLANRSISEALHFTTNRGLVGIFASKCLMSRAALPRATLLEHVLHLNSAYRAEAQPYFDKSEDWLDYVNLSISAVNSRFFRISQKWHHDEEVWWVILGFTAGIATHEGVYFATTNNSYQHCRRGKNEAGLAELFAPVTRCKNDWTIHRGLRGPQLTTCEQAEILYPNALSLDHLRTVYVSTDGAYDKVMGWMHEFDISDVRVVIDPQKFDGYPN